MIIIKMNGEEETRIERFNRYTTACLTPHFTSEDINIKDTYGIVWLLCPDLRGSKIDNAVKNHSKLDRNGLCYKLLTLCMRLFVAGLHTATPCDENGVPDAEYNFRTRYLDKRLKEPRNDIRKLEKQLATEKSSNHYEEMIDMKNKNKELMDKIKVLERDNDKLKQEVEYRDDKLENSVGKTKYEAVVKAFADFENSLNKTDS
tara:strand:- start:378 stop:986 length:609 start_codon:yes stop_codon:yes gene_type:complete